MKINGQIVAPRHLIIVQLQLIWDYHEYDRKNTAQFAYKAEDPDILKIYLLIKCIKNIRI